MRASESRGLTSGRKCAAPSMRTCSPAVRDQIAEQLSGLWIAGKSGRSPKTQPAPACSSGRAASLIACICAAPGASAVIGTQQRELGCRRPSTRWWETARHKRRRRSSDILGRGGALHDEADRQIRVLLDEVAPRHKPLDTRPVNSPVFMIIRASTRSAFSTAHRRPIGPPQS